MIGEVARVLDHDIRLVAVASQLFGNPWEQVVEDPNDPFRVRDRMGAAPAWELLARHAHQFGGCLGFIAGTKRASCYRVLQRLWIGRWRIRSQFLAATERKSEALTAHIDDVGDDAGDRILDPDERAVANLVFKRH